MNYHKIEHCNMNNGEGMRTVLWVSGCEHHCPECFNQQTWDENSGDKFGVYEKQELFRYLEEDWCSGVTLTGGDPLYPNNRIFILALVKDLKAYYPNKTIWIYTGYTFEDLVKDELCKSILEYTDVLCDGLFVKDLKSVDKHWVGSHNQRVIDVPVSLRNNCVSLKS